MDYFDREAERFGLETDGWKVRKGTRDYLAEMARVGVEGTLVDGLVYVWAMEQVRQMPSQFYSASSKHDILSCSYFSVTSMHGGTSPPI